MTDHTGLSAFGDEVYRDQANFRCRLRAYLYTAEQHAREAGITPQQYLLLLITRGHPNYPQATVGDLANSLKLAPSATSLLVDRAVKRGLLQRREDPDDRRKFLITLTPLGQRLLDRITEANQRDTADLQSELPDRLFASGE